MDQRRKAPKRIIFNVTEKFHETLKERAKERGIPMKIYILQALIDRLSEEDSY